MEHALPDNGLHLLLVDDHAVVRTGYRRLLEQADPDWSVAEAATGEAAYRMFAQQRFDVVVMDISLPGMSGLETLRRMRARTPGTRVLVFSMHDEAVFAEQALAAGACGYITKMSASEVLVEAVHTIADGGHYVGEDIRRTLTGGHSGPDLTALSPREFEIFRLMAEGRGVSDIARLLNIGYKTAANYCTRIRDKLGIGNGAQLARLAIREGVVRL
jgi:DNA-binding NarL/FixJ family response regulator